MRKRLLIAPLAFVITILPRPAMGQAKGLGVNLPVVGRFVGGGNVLFVTAVDVSNNSPNPTQVDFYLDGKTMVSGAPVELRGSIGASGTLGAQGTGGLMRGRSVAHFDDFIDALVQARLLPATVRTEGFLGSLLLVFDGQPAGGLGSATARFYNRLGDGFVSAALKGREILTREPQSLVAIVQDTRGTSTGSPQTYPNMFLNNTGLMADGKGQAGPVNLEISAIANSTGQPIGTPIVIADLAPGQTASISQVLNELKIPPGSEPTILVFARVISGNAAIHGLISQVDVVTRDGAVFEMSDFGEWSAPVNLGPVINSASNDEGPAISGDGLSLYFTSNRPGGSGSQDLWVATREDEDDPWGAPVNLGPTVNTSSVEQAPMFSPDGRRMFFVSDRPGGAGGLDIWVSRRDNVDDDFGWRAPVNLGSINTGSSEAGPGLFSRGNEEILWITSNRPGGAGSADIYTSARQQDGSFGPPSAVAELNSSAQDARPTLHRSGLEVFFFSPRTGSLGATDLWSSTRENRSLPWTTPTNLGPIVNSSFEEMQPALSRDARTIFFASNRPGGMGLLDLYMVTRMNTRKIDGPPR